MPSLVLEIAKEGLMLSSAWLLRNATSLAGIRTDRTKDTRHSSHTLDCFRQSVTCDLEKPAVPGLLLTSTFGDRGAGLGRTLSARALAAVECWAFLMLVPSASHTCSPSVSCTVKIWYRHTQRGRHYTWQ